VLVGFRRYRLRPAAANSTLTLRTRAGHLTRPFMRVSIRPKMAKVELRRLSLKEVAREVDALPEYYSWAATQQSDALGQMELGIAASKSKYTPRNVKA
ncbi:hypothetical protein, partial [uncultured Thiodictyon sp.]|uniref:hypothetical protein n=1 Tax=uncultured Thiodictyon sp. TaxID=1846217 RepID=UPI0025FACF49